MNIRENCRKMAENLALMPTAMLFFGDHHRMEFNGSDNPLTRKSGSYASSIQGTFELAAMKDTLPCVRMSVFPFIGPFSGIGEPVKNGRSRDNDWYNYERKVLLPDTDVALKEFLFGPEWVSLNNADPHVLHEQQIKRLVYIADMNPVPSNLNAILRGRDQWAL